MDMPFKKCHQLTLLAWQIPRDARKSNEVDKVCMCAWEAALSKETSIYDVKYFSPFLHTYLTYSLDELQIFWGLWVIRNLKNQYTILLLYSVRPE